MVNRRRRSKKWISWVIMLILLIAAGVICYLVWGAYFKDEPIEDAQETKEEPTEVLVQESEETPEEVPVKKEEVVLYEGGDPNNSETITGAITYAEVSGNNLVIRLNIDQFLEGGECALQVFEFGNEIYNDKARVVGSVSTATCEGFDIPTAAIGPGNFEIIVEVSSGEKTGTIKGEFSI